MILRSNLNASKILPAPVFTVNHCKLSRRPIHTGVANDKTFLVASLTIYSLVLASLHILGESIFIEIESSNLKTFCIDWLEIIERGIGLSALYTKVCKVISNQSFD